MFDMILLEFFAQCASIDAETGRGSRLVVVAVTQDSFQHGLLDFGDDRVEQVAGQLAVEVMFEPPVKSTP